MHRKRSLKLVRIKGRMGEAQSLLGAPMTRSLCGCILMLTIAAASGCADSRPRIPVRSVFVPKQDIPAGMKVANVAALFELQEFAADSLPDDVVDDPRKLQDMVCRRTLEAGRPFT